MVDRKADLQVQLNMLVLKLAELELDVQKLEIDLLFWATVYEQTKESCKKEAGQRKRQPCHQSETTPRPLLRIESSSSDSAFSEHSEISYEDTSTRFKIRRKEVPIKEMIARVQATSMFKLQPARSRGNSWCEGDDLFMTEGCGLETRHLGSSMESSSPNHVKQDLARDDSAVDMSADVRCAMEELGSDSRGFETQ